MTYPQTLEQLINTNISISERLEFLLPIIQGTKHDKALFTYIDDIQGDLISQQIAFEDLKNTYEEATATQEEYQAEQYKRLIESFDQNEEVLEQLNTRHKYHSRYGCDLAEYLKQVIAERTGHEANLPNVMWYLKRLIGLDSLIYRETGVSLAMENFLYDPEYLKKAFLVEEVETFE